jgi:TRAP-type uncharacterized transport system substrate-binding protein
MPADTQGANPLRFQADWGAANLTRTSGWLAQWVWEHTPDNHPSVIFNGRGMGDSFQALADAKVDVAVATPAAFARLAQQGTGPFEGRAIPALRSIAVLPHRDAMIPVARAELGFTTLSDVAAYDGPLRVSLGVNDRDGFMGFAADAVLAAAGIDLDAIVERGGKVRRYERPFGQIADLHEGRADLMISEAIMTPVWQALSRENDVTFLSLAASESQFLEQTWGIDTLEVPAGYFPRHDAALRALDYSGWIIATTAALPDELATLLAQAVVEDSETLARQYRHLPAEYSPLRYPIDYRLSMKGPIELHPAAAAVYEQAASEGKVAS